MAIAFDDNTQVFSRGLGGRIVSQDAEAGTISKLYTLGDAHRTLEGRVNAGVILSLIDETVSEIVPARTGNQSYGAVVSVTLAYLKPLFLGEVRVEARAISIGRTLGLVQAEVFDANGRLTNRAQITVAVQPLDQTHLATVARMDEASLKQDS